MSEIRPVGIGLRYWIVYTLIVYTVVNPESCNRRALCQHARVLTLEDFDQSPLSSAKPKRAADDGAAAGEDEAEEEESMMHEEEEEEEEEEARRGKSSSKKLDRSTTLKVAKGKRLQGAGRIKDGPVKLPRRGRDTGVEQARLEEEEEEEEEEGEGLDPKFVQAMREEQRRNLMEVMMAEKSDATRGRASAGDADDVVSDDEQEEEGLDPSVREEESGEVRFFDQSAERPVKNPLARIYGLDEGGEEDEEDESEIADADSLPDLPRQKGKGKGQRAIQELRGFGVEEEESETEKARRALSHARENRLGPGDFVSDSSDNSADPSEQRGEPGGDAGGGDGGAGSRFAVSSPKGEKARRKGGAERGSGERKAGRGDVTPRRRSAGRTGNDSRGEEEELADDQMSSQGDFVKGQDGAELEKEVSGFRHMSPSALRTPKLRQERREGRHKVDASLLRPQLEHEENGETESDDEEEGGGAGETAIDLLNLTPGVLQDASAQKRTSEASSGEQEEFLNLTPEVLQSRTPKSDPPQKADLGHLERDAPPVHARPRQREGVGLWQGAKGEQWWNPTDIQLGTQDTQFIQGLERERGRMIKEIAATDRDRSAMLANMTDADWQRIEEELREIQRLSLAELQQEAPLPGSEAVRGAPAMLEDDDDDDNPNAAALEETVERIRREQPGKVYANLAEGIVDLCSNYLVKHGTEEERQEVCAHKSA